jgi:hypothetical protein
MKTLKFQLSVNLNADVEWIIKPFEEQELLEAQQQMHEELAQYQVLMVEKAKAEIEKQAELIKKRIDLVTQEMLTKEDDSDGDN